MHVLLVKTSSLGDIIHALPALTDSGKFNQDIKFDWVIEENFAEVPTWHPLVQQVIPVALRRWRKNIWRAWRSKQLSDFYQQLREKKYDLVIDAQGLIKSAWITFLSQGPHCGYDRYSAWEPLACLAYQKKYRVEPEQHAIDRIRQLFAASLNYPVPKTFPDYGIDINKLPSQPFQEKYCVFVHATTQASKFWPEEYWQKLIIKMQDLPYKILLPWGNDTEHQRAVRLANNFQHVIVLPKSTLSQLAAILAHASAVVAVDTGIGHLSAALNTPTISLYGPTDPALIGTIGKNQIHLKSNSMAELAVETVWEKLSNALYLSL